VGLKELLLPREKIFFELLSAESHNVLLGARALHDLMLHYVDVPTKCSRIKEVEHNGDEIVHQIYQQLSKTFITPIDREEIGKLASLYDDVLDYIDAVAERMHLYEIASPTDAMQKLAELVVKSVMEIDFTIGIIHQIKEPQIEVRCNEVDRLENEADELLNESVAALFKTHDALTIIKLKEVYEFLETITDKCEDVVQLIRSIVLEYS